MTPVEIVRAIVDILVSGITEFATGIGSGISSAVRSMFFETNGDSQTLSVYAVMVLVFAGTSLCIGLTRLIFNWLGSLGNN